MDYLHERTRCCCVAAFAKSNRCRQSTEHAMLVGAVHGYRAGARVDPELKRELKARRLPVIATGGYAELIAAKLPEIPAVAKSDA
jgi:type III pantothenate kinase